MASKSAKGKVLKSPRIVRGSLESKFYERFGREPNDVSELDRFASTLSQEERSDAAAARSERTSVVNQVLDHNLRERSYMENRAANREEIMMQRDRKFLRRMMREWKKEQPHGIHTLDRGQEWLPGNVIPNPDRKIRFRTKQEAIDFTQANKPQRPGALVPGSELEGVISSMVNAERKARDERAASDATASVNAASKAGDAKSGPLYDYQFKRRDGEGVDAMLKRLETEVSHAADLQFADARAARAQRAAERQKRAEGRQLAAEVNASLDEMFPQKKPTQPTVATPAAVKAPVIPFPFNPSASLPPGGSVPPVQPKPSGAVAQKPESAVAKQARINAQREKELDVFAKQVEEHSRNDPYYTTSAEAAAFNETVKDIKSGNFGAIAGRLKDGIKFALVNDFGVSPTAVRKIGSVMRGDFSRGTGGSASPASVSHRSSGLWTPQTAKKSSGRPGKTYRATKDDFLLTLRGLPVGGSGNPSSIAHRSAGLWSSKRDSKTPGRKHQ